MREIKFRIFGSDHMTKPFTLFDIQSKKVEFTHEVKIMQFTGLKDKKGKEIYEGDILLLPDTESHSVDVGIGVNMKVAETPVGTIAEVVYKNGGFGVNVNDRGECWEAGFTSFHSTDYTSMNCDNSDLEKEIEIIGNIYKSPYLLQSKYNQSTKRQWGLLNGTISNKPVAKWTK